MKARVGHPCPRRNPTMAGECPRRTITCPPPVPLRPRGTTPTTRRTTRSPRTTRGRSVRPIPRPQPVPGQFLARPRPFTGGRTPGPTRGFWAQQPPAVLPPFRLISRRQ